MFNRQQPNPAPIGPFFAQPPPPPVIPPELFGANGVFLAFIPFAIATAVQYSNLRTGLIIATAAAGVIVMLGLVLFYVRARQIRIYIIDVAMLVVMAVQLGLSFPFHQEIKDNFNFITNAALTAVSLGCMLVGYPFTLQHVREVVARNAWRHGDVYSTAFMTGTLFTLVFIANTLLYLVPVARGLLDEPGSPLNWVFRILLPILLYLLAALITRLLPTTINSQLEQSVGFDGPTASFGPSLGPGGMPKLMMTNPLAIP